MARIIFTDAAGAVTLDNGLGAVAAGVAARFAAWTPFTRPIGHTRVALGTGARYMFAFRTDRGARFRVEELPALQLPVVLRLMAHLENGGAVRVETDDSHGRTYASCGLAPETVPELTLEDRRRIQYTLSLALINLGTTDDMLCEYAETPASGTLLLVAGPDRLPGATFARASTATYHALG